MSSNNFKSVEGFEGIYDLRSDGLLYSYPRIGSKGGYTYGSKNSEGYLCFSLYKDGKRFPQKLHILVYKTYIGEIPEGYDVHHKNHNKLDNRVENLELIEHIEHSKKHLNEHKEKMIKESVKSHSKKVFQYTLNGVFVKQYNSIKEAAKENGISYSCLRSCLRNNKNPYRGYIWSVNG